MPESFLLDTNVFDKIAADQVAFELVKSLTRASEIELVTTHVQEDELAQIKERAKGKRIAQIPRPMVATHGFVLDYSRLGMARLGGEDAIEAIRQGNWEKHTKDALIAATAKGEAYVLVTEDERLRNRTRTELGIAAWDWSEFVEHLRKLAAKQ